MQNCSISISNSTDPYKLHAILGMHDRIKRDGTRYDFMDIFIHPNFTALQYHDTSDIAIMKTKKPIMFSDVVKPICLPRDNSKYCVSRLVIDELINSFNIFVKLVTGMIMKKLLLLAGVECGPVEIILDIYKKQKCRFNQVRSVSKLGLVFFWIQ